MLVVVVVVVIGGGGEDVAYIVVVVVVRKGHDGGDAAPGFLQNRKIILWVFFLFKGNPLLDQGPFFPPATYIRGKSQKHPPPSLRGGFSLSPPPPPP